MARLKEFYKTEVIKKMTEQFGYTSPMQVPRIEKITLNMGVGEAVADKKIMEHAVGDMEKIAGQKAIVTKAKKSVAASGSAVFTCHECVQQNSDCGYLGDELQDQCPGLQGRVRSRTQGTNEPDVRNVLMQPGNEFQSFVAVQLDRVNVGFCDVRDDCLHV